MGILSWIVFGLIVGAPAKLILPGQDPHWRDLILFYEFFHGDSGAGIGASHQTGWTGLVGWLIKSLAVLDSKEVLEKGYEAAAMRIVRSY